MPKNPTMLTLALAGGLALGIYFLSAPFAISFLSRSHRDLLVSRPFTVLLAPANLLVRHCPPYEEYHVFILQALGKPLEE